MYETFFDTVRPLFGKLKQHQVDGMKNIIEYAMHNAVPRVHLAYMLSTVLHETAAWMQPIREGAMRYGPKYTDKSSRHAVAVLYAKGIVSRNYALPNSAGHSFYGRGLVQITHEENYARLGKEIGADLVSNPDLALEWEYALPILHYGMRDGLFTGISMDVITEDAHNFTNARRIVNGDVRRNGKKLAGYAEVFNTALAEYKPKEQPNEPENTGGSWPPRWWPFQPD